MSGVLPLNNSEMQAWAAMRGITVRGYEADALTLLDAVLRHPETPKESA